MQTNGPYPLKVKYGSIKGKAIINFQAKVEAILSPSLLKTCLVELATS